METVLESPIASTQTCRIHARNWQQIKADGPGLKFVTLRMLTRTQHVRVVQVRVVQMFSALNPDLSGVNCEVASEVRVLSKIVIFSMLNSDLIIWGGDLSRI